MKKLYAAVKGPDNLMARYTSGMIVDVFEKEGPFSEKEKKAYIMFQITPSTKEIFKAALQVGLVAKRVKKVNLNVFKKSMGNDIVDKWQDPSFQQEPIEGKTTILKNAIGDL